MPLSAKCRAFPHLKYSSWQHGRLEAFLEDMDLIYPVGAIVVIRYDSSVRELGSVSESWFRADTKGELQLHRGDGRPVLVYPEGSARSPQWRIDGKRVDDDPAALKLDRQWVKAGRDQRRMTPRAARHHPLMVPILIH